MKNVLKSSLACCLVLLAGCFRGSDQEIGAQLIKIATARDVQWAAVVAATQSPALPFLAKIEFVAKPEFAGKTVDEALALLPKDYPYSFVFLADERALEEEGFPCYCVDLLDERRPRIRVDAKHLASVENNLTMANMDFAEFAEAAKAKGVFRGL